MRTLLCGTIWTNVDLAFTETEMSSFLWNFHPWRHCQNDNFQCSQWLKFRQNDDIFVSVIDAVRWHSLKTNLTRSAQNNNSYNDSEIYTFKITSLFLKGQCYLVAQYMEASWVHITCPSAICRNHFTQDFLVQADNYANQWFANHI